jgi:hypothetical protein
VSPAKTRDGSCSLPTQVTLVASSTVVPTNSRRCSPAAARTPIDCLVYDDRPTQIFFDSRCIA